VDVDGESTFLEQTKSIPPHSIALVTFRETNNEAHAILGNRIVVPYSRIFGDARSAAVMEWRTGQANPPQIYRIFPINVDREYACRCGIPVD
jgi:hypothetical protein